MKFTLAAIGGDYDGKLSADGNTLSGTWTRGPAPIPLNLTRATKGNEWTIPEPPPPPKILPADAKPTFDVATIKPRLLPKLGITGRCRLAGRYLVVRGDLHEYRIHLGSGNILMEPGSRYLCIVQGAGDSAANVSLPFEGDRLLGVILSKAFLLMHDTKIKDESIRRQL